MWFFCCFLLPFCCHEKSCSEYEVGNVERYVSNCTIFHTCTLFLVVSEYLVGHNELGIFNEDRLHGDFLAYFDTYTNSISSVQ